MKTLGFRTELTTSAFVSGNLYSFGNLIPLPMMFDKTCSEVPYLLQEKVKKTNGLIRIEYTPNTQFRGRTITSSRMKDIIDGPVYPITVRNGSKQYLMGKGFVAECTPKGIKYLMVACVETDKHIISLSQVKLYVSKSAQNNTNRVISSVIREFVSEHSGDVLITNDIEKYLGRKIIFPSFKSVKQKKEYIDNLIRESLEQFCKQEGS